MSVMHYDEIYNYKTKTLLYDKIDEILDNITSGDVMLDAFNIQLIEYLKKIKNISNIKAILLYNDLDTYYESICLNKSTRVPHLKSL